MAIRGVKLNKNHIIQAIKQKRGIISHAAEMLNCDTHTIYDWIHRDEDVKKAIEEARTEASKMREEQDKIIVDKAYESIIALLEKHDVTATIYTLKTKGKWGEGNNNDIKITIKPIEKPYDHEHLKQ